MKRYQIRNSLLLLLTAVVWGVAFVAQSVGMEYIGAFTFNCVRCLIGGMVLIPCIYFLDRLKGREGKEASGESREDEGWNHTVLTGGVCCGIALFVAGNLQQFGISYTTVGKAGFITAMYIVIVPLLGIFMKKKTGVKIWVSVALAAAGLYLLCMTERLSISLGDGLVLLCAVGFSVQILLVDYFSPRADGVRLACVQFFVCGLLSGAGMLLFEKPTLSAIAQAALPVGYAGVLSCGVGYTLQIVGQKGMDPTVASLILSLESVVSVLAGWLILGQKLSMRELFGCVLMFAAIILAQLPEKRSTGAAKTAG